MLGERIDVDGFNVEFTKKFTNFCMKAPLNLSYALAGDTVKLYKDSDTLLLSYSFDYTRDVKSNIYEIRKVLVNEHYPRFTFVEETELSVPKEVVQQKYERGEITIDELLDYKEKVVKEIRYVIEKVIYHRDELFIRKEGTRDVLRYKMKMPVIYFLNKLIQGEYSKEDAGSVFVKKSYQLVD